MWKFLVKNQSIEILEREVLADHQIQYVQFRFTFDGDWRRFHKVVQFSQGDETYNIVLGTDGTSLYLPAELHVGAAKMSVFGYDTESDTTVRATTVPVTLNIRKHQKSQSLSSARSRRQPEIFIHTQTKQRWMLLRLSFYRSFPACSSLRTGRSTRFRPSTRSF